MTQIVDFDVVADVRGRRAIAVNALAGVVVRVRNQSGVLVFEGADTEQLGRLVLPDGLRSGRIDLVAELSESGDVVREHVPEDV